MGNLTKADDVRQFVIKRPLTGKEGKKPKTKAPKIQRLITPVVLQRKRNKLALKRLRLRKTRSRRLTPPSCWLSARRRPRRSVLKRSDVLGLLYVNQRPQSVQSK